MIPMKKNCFSLTLVFLFFVIVCSSGCNNSRKIPKDFDYGSWTGPTYKNDFFGFSITIPKDWYIAEKEEMKAIMKDGFEELQNANLSNEKEIKKVAKIAEITTANLFAVMRYSEEEALEKEDFNPNIASLVEKLPAKMDRAQYVKIARHTLSEAIPNLVVKSETNKMVGGQEFVSLEMEFEMYGIPIYQEQLICLKNGFAVYFCLTWLDDSDKKQLDAIMATLTWE